MTRKVDFSHTIKFECIHCGRLHEVEIYEGMNIRKGDVIEPYSGGGMWGRCRFCRRAGLRAVTEPPRSKKGPVGWRKIPTA